MTKIHELLRSPAGGRAELPDPTERARLRRVQGLTQAQVAHALDVTPAAVSGWEKGRHEPIGETRQKYAELLRLIAERRGEGGRA